MYTDFRILNVRSIIEFRKIKIIRYNGTFHSYVSLFESDH